MGGDIKRVFVSLRNMSLIIISVFGLITILASGGGGGADDNDDNNNASTTYKVIYSANGSDSGDVPVDATGYQEGASVTVLGNTGILEKGNYTFTGWCTSPDGNGTEYLEGAKFTMGGADVTLYAIWAASEALETLQALGVNLSPALPRLTTTQEDGTETVEVDPGNWHPLKDTYTVFSPRAEVFQTGIGINSSYISWWEDSDDEYAVNYPAVDSASWETATKSSVAADVDADGLEEIVVFYIISGNIYMRVFNDGAYSDEVYVDAVSNAASGGYYWLEGGFSSLLSETQYNSLYYPYFQVASGDLDGDEKDEIILVDYMTVQLLDVEATESGCSVELMTDSSEKNLGEVVTSVTAGDPDGDGLDEVGVCLKSSGFNYYDAAFSPKISTISKTAVSGSAQFLEACFGDFDGDRVDELALCGVEQTKVVVKLYETTTGEGIDPTPIKTISYITKKYIENGFWLTKVWYPSKANPLALDLDGDGKKELFVVDRVYDDPMNEAIYIDMLLELETGDRWVKQVDAGDIDCDGKEDLVVLFHDIKGTMDSITGTIIGVGQRSNQTDAEGNIIQIETAIEQKKTYMLEAPLPKIGGVDAQDSAGDNTMSLIVGNVDADSPRVKYTGHKLGFTDPIILAVLVSPPYWSDIAGSNEAYEGSIKGWTTLFGQKTSNSATNENSMGFSIGMTLEFEQEGSLFGLKIAQVKGSISFKENFDWRMSTTYEVSKMVKYSAIAGEDKVIFSSVPMDVYSYEVIDSNDPLDIGLTMTIDVPRDFTYIGMEREMFNTLNGDLSDIDDTVVSHTIGDPKSYPTEPEKNSLLEAYLEEDKRSGYESELMAVGLSGSDDVASGVTNAEIEITEGTADSWSRESVIEGSLGGGGAGWAALIDAGYQTGYSYTVTNSVGSFFGGTVGYLPPSYWTVDNYYYRYTAGLFAYPYIDERNGHVYWIVNYWMADEY